MARFPAQQRARQGPSGSRKSGETDKGGPLPDKFRNPDGVEGGGTTVGGPPHGGIPGTLAVGRKSPGQGPRITYGRLWARAVSTSRAKAAGSPTASSARTFRSRMTPAFEPAHEARVGQPQRAAGGVDAQDPQGPELALLGPAVAVGKGQSPEDRLGGGSVQPPATTPVPLGLLEDFLPTLAGLLSPPLARGMAPLLLASLGPGGRRPVCHPTQARPLTRAAGPQDSGA